MVVRVCDVDQLVSLAPGHTQRVLQSDVSTFPISVPIGKQVLQAE